ncbi:MAG: GNAT family N-acetyltransferase [Thermoplasmata archaeon]
MIRDLQWADFPELVENYYALYDEVRSNPDVGIHLFPQKPTLGEEAQWFSGLFRGFREGKSVVAVAEEDRKAVGLCQVDPKGVHLEGQHIGVLGIMVAAAYRNRGIGKALLTYAIDKCRGKFEIVELSVFATNAHGRALYQSVGFRSWGILPKAIRRENRYTDLEHMYIDLGITTGR